MSESEEQSVDDESTDQPADQEKATDTTDADTPAQNGEPETEEDLDEILAGLEERGAQIYEGKKFITIRKNGQVAINSTVTQQHFDDAEAVVLAMDAENKEMLIRPLSKHFPDRESVRSVHKSNDSAMFSAQSFLSSYDLDTENALRYNDLEWDKNDKLLHVDLSQTPEQVSTTRGEDTTSEKDD